MECFFGLILFLELSFLIPFPDTFCGTFSLLFYLFRCVIFTPFTDFQRGTLSCSSLSSFRHSLSSFVSTSVPIPVLCLSHATALSFHLAERGGQFCFYGLVSFSPHFPSTTSHIYSFLPFHFAIHVFISFRFLPFLSLHTGPSCFISSTYFCLSAHTFSVPVHVSFYSFFWHFLFYFFFTVFLSHL